MNRIILIIALLLGFAYWAANAGLETGTYIDDLVTTNPTSSDSATQGDDHLRLIKSVLKATFPNIDGPVTATEDELNSPSTPAGAIMWWPAATVPTNWIECDGSSLSRATYADLFSALSTTYGAVDGNSFNIPDVRGQFIRGIDNGRGFAPDVASRTAPSATGATGSGGDNVGTTQTDQNTAHTHTTTTKAALSSSPSSSGTSLDSTGNANSGAVTVNSSGGNEARPNNIAFKCIIYSGL